MKCAECHFPIYEGFEVFYRKEAYHPDCVVKVKKEAPVTRKKRSKFRLISGGKTK